MSDLPDAQAAAEKQMAHPLFVCAECGEPVIAYAGRQFRTCEHVEGGVLATPEGIKAVSSGV